MSSERPRPARRAPAARGNVAPPRARKVRRVLALTGLAAVVFAGASPIARDLGELAAALGDAASGVVVPEELRWEPSGGLISDALFGRKVLFLARATPGAPRDLYRARVRLSHEGRPLGIVSVHNLTQTSIGDDHALVVRGSRAAFVTSAFGQAQSLSVLDLAPKAAPDAPGGTDRLLRWLTGFQETGDGAGIKRLDVTMDPPPGRVGLELLPDQLRVDFDAAGAVKTAVLDLGANDLLGAKTPETLARGDASGLRAELSSRPPKRFIHWAVDTVRAVSWIGPAPIAWLEEKVFSLRDTAKQAAFRFGGASAEVRTDTPSVTAAPVLLSAHRASEDDGSWPPPAIASIWKTPEAGEGEWVLPKISWIKRLDVAGAPSAFLRTFVRPDEQRPYARVLLVAMDSRRLDLEMEAGSEDPKPLTGPSGPGRIPRDPRISTRVVAAFNGAFKTEHGFYGMMVKRRVLLPPQPNAATVVLMKDGRAGFGAWGPGKELLDLGGYAADDIVSLRQNLDPLVDGGRVNPQKRAQWGYTLPGTSMQTERSGLCVTATGHMLYAWGDDVSGMTLAKGMQMAGCTFGMHLDMNPHHTGFLFTNVDDLRGRKYRSELLSPDMEIPTDRYLEHAAKDFFYVLVRDPSPPATSGAPAWAPAKGVQPPPSWFTGLFETEAKGGGIELFDVEPERATYRIRRGAHEPKDPNANDASSVLDEGDASRVLFAAGLGVAHEKRARGLVVRGVSQPTPRGVAGSALVIARGTSLRIQLPNESAAALADADAVELPLLFAGAEVGVASPARPPGTTRSALGTADSGRVVVARGRDATDRALADALRGAGCQRGVLLDRGEGSRAIFDRSGTPDVPRARYDETALYGVATPLRPRAFRFETAAAPPKAVEK